MAHLSVQCQNCGAKYKIPETFTGDRAKCKACGNVIDVKAAREAHAQAEEQPSTSAAAPKKSTREPRRKAASKTEGPASGTKRRGRRSDSDGEDGRRRRPKKRDNSMLIAGAGIVVLAGVALSLWAALDTGEEETTEQTSQSTPDPEAGTPPVAEPDETNEADAQAEDASTTQEEEKPKPKLTGEEAFLAKVRALHESEGILITGSVLESFDTPEGLNEEASLEINGLLDDLREDGGLASIRAPALLQARGFRMIPLALNRLLTLDLANPEDIIYASKIADTFSVMADNDYTFYFPTTDIVDIEQCFENCGRTWDMHAMTKQYFQSEVGVDAYIKDFKTRDTSKLKGSL